MYIGKEFYNKATFYYHSLDATLQTVERLSKEYFTDMMPFINYSLDSFFKFVSQNIQYVPDPDGLERVCRPGVTLKAGFGDCDDKTVLCLAFFLLKKISCGYSIISNSPNKSYHHIFPFILIQNIKFDYDATYPDNRPYTKKTYAKRWDKILYKGKT